MARCADFAFGPDVPLAAKDRVGEPGQPTGRVPPAAALGAGTGRVSPRSPIYQPGRRASLVTESVQIRLQGVLELVVAAPELRASVLVIVVDVVQRGFDGVRHPGAASIRGFDSPGKAFV